MFEETLDSMQDFRARRGYAPAFIAKVQAKRRAEAEALAAGERRKAEELRFKALVDAQIAAIKADKARRQMNEDAVRKVAAPGWVRDVIRDVCARRGLDAVGVLSKKRSNVLAYARHEIYYLLRSAPSTPSFPTIGRWFNVDHTSALYGATVHAKRNGLPEVTNYDIVRRAESLARYHSKAMGRTLREAR
jgi:hypothetical protein